MHTRKYLFLMFLLVSVNSLATTTFDTSTNILNLDAVVLNNTQYNNVVLQLTAYNVVSVGASGSLGITCATTTSPDTFDASTNILNLDFVILNNIQYNNVVLKLTNYKVISVGSSAPVTPTPVSGTCSSANFSTAIFNAITVGMTMNQVNQTIGCSYDPTRTINIATAVQNTWLYQNPTTYAVEMIQVYFDPTDSIATPLSGVGSDFKSSVGF